MACFCTAMARHVPGTCALVAGSSADGVLVTVGVCQRVRTHLFSFYFFSSCASSLEMPFSYLERSRRCRDVESILVSF